MRLFWLVELGIPRHGAVMSCGTDGFDRMTLIKRASAAYLLAFDEAARKCPRQAEEL
jgi:hypothetical protein